ncbi:hypothetical protein IMY05_C1151000500 [Salix suchowensis]|nr:hypothetical protein IMY05_C1151000500 [Salix suchowensis]
MRKSRPSEPTSPERIGSPRVVDGVELEVEDGTLWGPYLSSTDSFDSLFDCISSDDLFESYFDGGADGGADADSESCQSDIDREQMNLDSDDAGSAIGGEHTSDNEDREGSEEGDFVVDNESASEDDTSDESQDEGSSDGQTCGKRRRRTTKNRFNPCRPPASFSFADGYICRSVRHDDGSECTELKVFGLHYSVELDVIICKTHSGGCLVPTDNLLQHVKSHHSQDLTFGLKHRPKSEWSRIGNHLLSAHGIDAQQTCESLLRSLPTHLQNPLLVKGRLRYKSIIADFYKCPREGCRMWAIHVGKKNISSEYNIRRHYRETHDDHLPPIQRSRAQKIMVLSGKQEICAWFKLPAQSSQAPRAQTTSMDAPSSSTRSPSAQPSRPIDESVMQATWMIRLGWTNYLESLGTGMLVETLMQLAAPLYSSTNIPACPSNMEYLELSLRVLNQESGSYFMNSNNFLNSRHASLRSVVVARSAKSKFHDIRMETMQKYRRPLVMTLTFMTCFLQRKADGTTQGFGLFKIEGHPSQIEAADALRKHFLHQKGVPNIQTMCQLMHSAFVALLCPPHLKDTAIACPTDQALLLLALAGPASRQRFQL